MSDIADEVWRKAFCQLYRVRRPCVPLGDIIHWRAVIDALGVGSHLDHDFAYVPSGYFYQTYTPAPTRPEVEVACRYAHRHGARWVLYPVMHQPAAAAGAELGGVELPWFVSAEYEVRRGVDEDLRDQLGGARFREIARLSRRAAEQVTWHASTGEPAPDALASFDRLHRLNLDRYGHRHNHFARPILAELIRSPLRDNLCLFRHLPTRGGDPVQAVLALRSREAAAALLHLQVQGIDHARVTPAVNLYATMLYRIFHWGAANGIRRFDLGRGAHAAKLNLGANRFQVVSNLLVPVAPSAEPTDLTGLRKAAAHAVDGAVDQLRTTVGRRGVAAQIELPQRREQ